VLCWWCSVDYQKCVVSIRMCCVVLCCSLDYQKCIVLIRKCYAVLCCSVDYQKCVVQMWCSKIVVPGGSCHCHCASKI